MRRGKSDIKEMHESNKQQENKQEKVQIFIRIIEK